MRTVKKLNLTQLETVGDVVRELDQAAILGGTGIVTTTPIILTIYRKSEGIDASGNPYTLDQYTVTGGVTLGTQFTGYMIEPGGPSTTQSGLNQRIPQGTYNMVEHNTASHPQTFDIFSTTVSQDRGILIHPGNTAADSLGCFLPGTGEGADQTSVTNSRTAMTQLYNYIEQYGNANNVTVVVVDIPD